MLKGLLHIDGRVTTAGLKENNFDALRLIFASMVVLFHTGLLSQARGLAWTAHVSATFAVQAFFVVSGFLVTMSYENTRSARSYFLKRLRRIAPAYIVVVVTAAVALSMLSTLPPSAYFSSPQTWRYLGLNLVLSNFSAPTLPGVFTTNFIPAVNGSLWTIKIEVAFYCLVPLMVMGARRFGPSRLLAAVFAGSVAWKLGFDLAYAHGGAEIYSKLAKQVPGQLSFFAGGAWAYYRTRNCLGIRFWMAAVAALVYFFGEGFVFQDVTAPLAVTAIVYWSAVAAPRMPEVPRRDDFSYGLYLYHFPIIQSFIALNVFQYSTVLAVLALALTVTGCAVISWRYIEQPILVHKPGAASPR